MDRQNNFKFKFWDKQKKEFSAMPSILLKPDINGVYSFNLKEERFVPLQFTGITDNEGNDIFTGDIVEYTYLMGPGDACTDIGEVLFIDGIFYIDKSNLFANNDSNLIKDSIKIIGNVFQDKHLVYKEEAV